ncbi:MAG: tyrosine--tRNA ligase, partial [Acholeplasmataceae bacterium]|nr:tyrosine--tRNA ligase [Acholeplasmataceae bacterium]
VHGREAYEQAVKISEALFSGNIKELSVEEIAQGFKDVPSVEIEGDINIVDVLVMVNAASSKRQAREFLTNGAISINGEVVKDFDFVISKENAIVNQFTVVKRGRKNYYLIKH